jgi:hypothetical protein
MSCGAGIALEQLIDHWRGELHAEEDTRVEEHVFECDACTARLQWIAALDDAVRELVRGGAFGLPVTRALVDRFVRGGVVVRQYELDPGSTVHCSAAPEDHFGITWFRGELVDADRIDIQFMNRDTGQPVFAAADLPFDRDRGEIGIAASARLLRALPAHTMDVTVTKFRDGTPHEVGRYTMLHSPWRS